jgi:hypothetical protein
MKVFSNDEDHYNSELSKILHHPGYITPAELDALAAGLEAMIMQTRALIDQRKAFLLQNKAMIGESANA